MSSKPNILFILSDQHNAKFMGHEGHPDVKTPHLDQLAKEGTRFSKAITQNPICTPSRTCFHSGQYAHNHGIYNLCGPAPTLPNIYGHFKQQGYTTAAIGKIHCPENWIENQTDVFLETNEGCSIGDAPEYQQHVKDQGQWEAYERDETRTGMSGQSLDGYLNHLPYRDTPEGWSVEQTKAFILQAKANNQPFLCHTSFPRPHQTYAPSEEFWNMYDENNITMPPNWQWDMKNKAPHLVDTKQYFQNNAEAISDNAPYTYEALCRRKMRGYLGNISMMDHAVGELMTFLKEQGLDEDTIVVYSADHGDYACEHGVLEKAPGICSDAITRIPMIWKYPKHIKADHICHEIAETVDVSTTLCQLAEVEPLLTSDGQDLSQLLQGKGQAVHNIGVTEFAWSKSIRKGDFRLVYYPPEMFQKEYPQGFGELYDLQSDPHEMNNLFFDPAHRERVLELQSDLLNWLITTTRVVGTNGVKLPADEPQSVETFKIRTRLDGKIGYRELSSTNHIKYL